MVQVFAVDRPELPPLLMPEQFRLQIPYFMSPSGDEGVPELAPGEYWIRLENTRRWLDDFVVEVGSPLDAATKAEIELSEDQERWLEWMLEHQIERVRLGS